MGWGRTLTFMPYGKLWQMHRKTLQTTLSNTNARQWQEFQAQEARRSVAAIIQHPESWDTSLRRFAVAIVLKVSYGLDITDDSDPYVQIANDALYATGNGGTPGTSIVDAIPIGMPGSCFGSPSPCFRVSHLTWTRGSAVHARLACP